MPENTPTLQVKNLNVLAGEKRVLKNIEFELYPGDVLGLIGETGSGKTVLIDALGRNTAAGLKLTADKLYYRTEDWEADLTQLDEQDLSDRVWGKKITFIPSNARGRFSPIMTVGEQLINILKSNNNDLTDKEAEKRALKMFALTQMPDPEQNMKNYPHELSGGMIQRVEIAAALSASPKFLLADEPTMGLDVTVQRQILDLMDNLFKNMHSTVALATRDLGVAANYCNKIATLFDGEIVEFSDVESFFERPRHPYSRYLLEIAFVSNGKNPKSKRRVFRSEQDTRATGCFCSGSCEKADAECFEKPPDIKRLSNGRFVRCCKY